MKKILLTLSIASSLLMMQSCSSSSSDNMKALEELEKKMAEEKANAIEKVTYKDLFEIEFPESMSESTTLNDVAVVQQMDGSKELYTIVVQESIAEMHTAIKDNGLEEKYPLNINGYFGILETDLATKLLNQRSIKKSNKTINGMPAVILNVNGDIGGVPIHYTIAYVQGKENYYQVMTWTLEGEKEKENQPAMDKIIASFKEL
ncbi:MAG: hypothetical protein ACK476_16325 [Fluviicola sp.]